MGGLRPALAGTVLAGTVLALAAAAAGCSRPADSGGIATAAGAGASPSPTVVYADPNARFDVIGWTRCLRRHGVPVDDPDPGEPNGKPRIHQERVGADKVNAAAEACRRFNPNWGRPSRPDPELQEKMRRFARCMWAHGIPFDDPEPELPPGAPTVGAAPTGPTPGGPAFDRALAECDREVPGIVTVPRGQKK